MKRLLPILLTALVASCATKAVPSGKVSAPPVAANVLPLIVKAEADAQKANTVAIRLESQVDGLKIRTGTLQQQMTKATAEADRLRVAKTATEAELSGVYDMLVSANEKISELVLNVQIAWDTAAEQRVLREESEATRTSLVSAIAQKDLESEGLRKLAGEQSATIQMQAEELEKARDSAVLGRYVKWGIGIAVVGFLALTALKLFLAGTIPKIL